MSKSDKIWCAYLVVNCVGLRTFWMPLVVMTKLSVCQTRGLWQNERNLCSHSYTTWKIIHLCFLTRRMVGGATLSTWNFGWNCLCWRENDDFQSTFARSASAITPSEGSSIKTTRKSTTRFPMRLRWTSYVVRLPKAQKGAEKRKTALSV